MKVVFVDLGETSYPIKSAPSVQFEPDEMGVNKCTRCFISMIGNLPQGDETELSGIIKWLSDDDMLLDQYVVENFQRYEIHNTPGQEGDEHGTIQLDPVCTVLLTNEAVPAPAPEPVEPTEEEILAAAKAGKDREIANSRDSIISAGIDVETTYGLEHFTLNEKDKTLLLGINAMIQAGAESYPYHSINLQARDTNPCTVYSKEDIGKIAQVAFGFITYHETYANMLLQWLDRETDPDVVRTITYGVALPDDLQTYMEMTLMAAGIDASQFASPEEEDAEMDPAPTETTTTTETTTEVETEEPHPAT